MRNYNEEQMDTNTHKYSYDFDNIMKNYMMRTFQPYLPGGRALEIGCYKGEFTEKLLTVYDDITVVEPSEELSKYTQKRLANKVEMVNSTFEKSELLVNSYDAIFIMHTLEHVNSPVEVLEKCKKILTKNGKIFLVVPNGNAPSRQIAVKMGIISYNSAVTEDEKSHGHHRTYTMDTLESDVKKAGLCIYEKGGIMFKALANFQIDSMLEKGIIDHNYLEGCYQFGKEYPNLCASIFLVCTL